MQKTAGIHHITAMVNDAQRNIDFYAGVLGLRLDKKNDQFRSTRSVSSLFWK